MRPFLQKAWLVLRTALLINAGFLALLLIGLALLAFTPIYKLAGRESAPDEWELKTKSMSDEELLARLEEAVKLATADGTYWDTLKTAEEQYPGRYSPDNPPPYWTRLCRTLSWDVRWDWCRAKACRPTKASPAANGCCCATL